MALTPDELLALQRAESYNGARYDSESNAFGLAGDGYKTNWPKGLNDTARLASAVAREASAAADSAAAAADWAVAADGAAGEAVRHAARFLAPAATAPAARDDGDSLEAGDCYLNTVQGAVFVYSGTGWVASAIDPALYATSAEVADTYATIATVAQTYLALAGGAMAGPLTLATDPGADLEAATKRYVDAHAGLSWEKVSGASGLVTVNKGYITTGADLVTMTLPSTFSVGDEVVVVGYGPGGWRLNAAENTTIVIGDFSIGSLVASGKRYDSTRLIAVEENAVWVAANAQGAEVSPGDGLGYTLGGRRRDNGAGDASIRRYAFQTDLLSTLGVTVSYTDGGVGLHSVENGYKFGSYHQGKSRDKFTFSTELVTRWGADAGITGQVDGAGFFSAAKGWAWSGTNCSSLDFSSEVESLVGTGFPAIQYVSAYNDRGRDQGFANHWVQNENRNIIYKFIFSAETQSTIADTFDVVFHNYTGDVGTNSQDSGYAIGATESSGGGTGLEIQSINFPTETTLTLSTLAAESHSYGSGVSSLTTGGTLFGTGQPGDAKSTGAVLYNWVADVSYVSTSSIPSPGIDASPSVNTGGI